MNCIILGDRPNKRMKSKGCPALIPYNKSISMVEHQCKLIRNIFGDRIQIIYIYGFESKKFVEFLHADNTNDIIGVYNPHYLSNGQGGSLYAAIDYLDTECLIINGYNTLNKNHLKKIKLELDIPQVVLAKSEGLKYDKPGGLVVDGYIQNFGFDLQNVVEEIYYINKSATEILRTIINNNLRCNYFLFEILNEMIANSIKIQPILL